MWPTSRRRASAATGENPLIPVLRPFDHELRRALYSAANAGSLRRRTWNGCAFNRAASILGMEVGHLSGAADAFHLPVQQVNDFITTWDRLRGSDSHCTELLRDALVTVGLFCDSELRSSEHAEACSSPSSLTPTP